MIWSLVVCDISYGYIYTGKLIEGFAYSILAEVLNQQERSDATQKR